MMPDDDERLNTHMLMCMKCCRKVGLRIMSSKPFEVLKPLDKWPKYWGTQHGALVVLAERGCWGCGCMDPKVYMTPAINLEVEVHGTK